MATELRIGGYAAMFDSPTIIQTPSGPFAEIVRPGAFSRTLRDLPDVFLLNQHAYDRPLSRTRNGSLSLVEDSRGLRFEAALPNTTDARDVHEMVRTGVLDGMSFGFHTTDDRWADDYAAGMPLRELMNVELFEISIVTRPAYATTSVATRRQPTRAVQQRLAQLMVRRGEVVKAV
ncbi:MAG: HK97 family phage prohead protease [Planctomycetaceae bacterium]|nr:HK97 family phage prohead protease [Planctomycetaceae bacterium]